MIEAAKKDPNYVSTLLGVDMTTGLLPTKVYVDESTHRMLVNAVISGTVTVDTTGLATSAKQDTGNTSLGSIDTKTPALGQALAAASVPVVLTAAQLSTLTPFSTVALGAGVAEIGNVKNSGTFAVQATLTAETTKVIGVTRTADGAGNLITSTGNALDINLKSNPLVAAPLVGQSKIAITGTAVNLNGGTSQPLTNGIIISAPSGNITPISVGTSGVNNTANGTGNGYLLAAGASISFAVTNTNVIWINGTASDYVSWAAS